MWRKERISAAKNMTSRSSSRPEKFDPAKWQFSPSVTVYQRVRNRCSTAPGALTNQECATGTRKPGASLNSNTTASRAVSFGHPELPPEQRQWSTFRVEWATQNSQSPPFWVWVRGRTVQTRQRGCVLATRSRLPLTNQQQQPLVRSCKEKDWSTGHPQGLAPM